MFPRHIQQNGCGRTAILRTVINARQHDQGGCGWQAKGDRQQKGDGHHRADTRQNPDQGADRHTQQAVAKIAPGQRDLKSQQKIIKQFHGDGLEQRQAGRQQRQRDAKHTDEQHSHQCRQPGGQRRRFPPAQTLAGG